MTRDELKRSGLLDQYVLGLLGPERSAEVERLIEEDPFLEQEVEKLRADLYAYADSRDIAPPPNGRRLRTAEEFQDLDHEMITAMMERNHTLNIWRYLLSAACFLLIGLCGYLFRLKENVRAELVTEQSLHAQDEASHRRNLDHRREVTRTARAEWKGIESFNQTTDTGQLRVHLLPGSEVVLLDFSALPPPSPGHAYHIYLGGKNHGFADGVVTASESRHLVAVHNLEGDSTISIFHFETGRKSPPRAGDQPFLTMNLQY